MEKTMVTMVISEFKSLSRLKIFRETGPWTFRKSLHVDFHGEFLTEVTAWAAAPIFGRFKKFCLNGSHYVSLVSLFKIG